MLHCALYPAQTCILAGCDFVKGLPGIGMKKAHTHMKRLRSFLKVSSWIGIGPLIIAIATRTIHEDLKRIQSARHVEK